MTTIIYKTNFRILTHQQATSLKNIYEEDQIVNLREDWYGIIETGLPVNCLVFTHLKKKKIRELINRPECDFIHFNEAIEVLRGEITAESSHENFMKHISEEIQERLWSRNNTSFQLEQLNVLVNAIELIKSLDGINNYGNKTA